MLCFVDLLNSDEKRIVKLINEETKRVETVVRLLQKKLNDAKVYYYYYYYYYY